MVLSFQILCALLFTFFVRAAATDLEARGGAPALPSGWKVASACVTDDGKTRVFNSTVGALALQRNVLLNLTPARCLSLCAKNGYGHAALRLGTECWCGASKPKLVGRPKAECNRPCAGDRYQKCGGGKTSTVYSHDKLGGKRPALRKETPRVKPGWSVAFKCVADPTLGANMLAGAKIFELQNNSPIACTSLCRDKGYALAGVEYSNECMCGKGWKNGKKPAVRPEKECNMACTGDSGRITCGAGHRVQLYKHSSFKRSENATEAEDAEFYADEAADE